VFVSALMPERIVDGLELVEIEIENGKLLAAGTRYGAADPELLAGGAFGACLQRWRKHYDSYGGHLKQAYTGSMAYPRMAPDTAIPNTPWPPCSRSTTSSADVHS